MLWFILGLGSVSEHLCVQGSNRDHSPYPASVCVALPCRCVASVKRQTPPSPVAGYGVDMVGAFGVSQPIFLLCAQKKGVSKHSISFYSDSNADGPGYNAAITPNSAICAQFPRKFAATLRCRTVFACLQLFFNPAFI